MNQQGHGQDSQFNDSGSLCQAAERGIRIQPYLEVDTLPMAVAILSVFAVVVLPERRVIAETIPFPAVTEEPVLREAK